MELVGNGWGNIHFHLSVWDWASPTWRFEEESTKSRTIHGLGGVPGVRSISSCDDKTHWWITENRTSGKLVALLLIERDPSRAHGKDITDSSMLRDVKVEEVGFLSCQIPGSGSVRAGDPMVLSQRRMVTQSIPRSVVFRRSHSNFRFMMNNTETSSCLEQLFGGAGS